MTLPVGWQSAPLGEVCRVVSGGTPKTSVPEYWDGDIAWITPKDLSLDRSQVVHRGGRSISRAGLAASSAVLFPPNSVILSSRAPIGYVAIAGHEMAVNQGCKVAIPPPDLDPRYLYWFLVASKPDLEARASGTTFKEISGKEFARTTLRWPGLTEQHRLVATLEGHLSRLGAADLLLDGSRVRAKRLRTAAATAAVRSAGGTPSLLADHVREIRNGIFISRAGSVPDGVPILRIGAVRPLRLDLSDVRYSARTEEELERADALLTPGDIVFTRYNGNPQFVGACAVVPPAVGPLTYPDKLIRVRVVDHVDPHFLALACSVGEGRRQIQAAVKTTSGQAGISGKDLRGVSVALPDLQAQQRAVATVERVSGYLPALDQKLHMSARRGDALKWSLLTTTFQGRLSSEP